MLEIEVKLRVESLADVQERLGALGWSPGERLFERNTVYDLPDGALDRSGKLLRIRETGGRATLTVKLPAGDGGPHKVREEHNLDGPAETLRGMVEGLGFQSAWRYEKYRTRYRKPGEAGVVELDETPVGNFLELEGPPEWIDATASQMGFPRTAYIASTYRDLFLDWRSELPSPPRDMIFSG